MKQSYTLDEYNSARSVVRKSGLEASALMIPWISPKANKIFGNLKK